MLQKDFAKQFGVCKSSVINSEANKSEPEVRFMPAVIAFLAITRRRKSSV